MTTTDRTAATDAEFEQRLARIEAAEEAPESAVERVARAIHQEQNRGAHWELTFERVREEYRRLARAALAAMSGPEPDTGALRRVKALAEELDVHGTVYDWRPIIAMRLRAALRPAVVAGEQS